MSIYPAWIGYHYLEERSVEPGEPCEPQPPMMMSGGGGGWAGPPIDPITHVEVSFVSVKEEEEQVVIELEPIGY